MIKKKFKDPLTTATDTLFQTKMIMSMKLLRQRGLIALQHAKSR